MNPRRRRRHMAPIRAAALALAGVVTLVVIRVAGALDKMPPADLLDRFVAACPLADPADMAAFQRCRGREAAFADSMVWGGDAAGKPLNGLTLTRFDPTLFIDLCMSLYMAEGPRA